MSKIVDQFNPSENDQITITGDGLKQPLDMSGESEGIDLSTPQIITITTNGAALQPFNITTAPEGSVVIKAQSGCTVSGPTLSSDPPGDIWTVTPDANVTSFRLEITLKDNSNSMIDPNATVTVGEPPN